MPENKPKISFHYEKETENKDVNYKLSTVSITEGNKTTSYQIINMPNMADIILETSYDGTTPKSKNVSYDTFKKKIEEALGKEGILIETDKPIDTKSAKQGIRIVKEENRKDEINTLLNDVSIIKDDFKGGFKEGALDTEKSRNEAGANKKTNQPIAQRSSEEAKIEGRTLEINYSGNNYERVTRMKTTEPDGTKIEFKFDDRQKVISMVTTEPNGQFQTNPNLSLDEFEKLTKGLNYKTIKGKDVKEIGDGEFKEIIKEVKARGFGSKATSKLEGINLESLADVKLAVEISSNKGFASAKKLIEIS